jgi:biotin operon repressor
MRTKTDRNRKLYTAYKSNPDADYALIGRAFGISRQAVRAIIKRMEKQNEK